MLQEKINVMDIIVEEMVNGKKLSEALKEIYKKRNVVIPYTEEMFDILVVKFNISTISKNALLRMKLKTINDVIAYASENSLIRIPSLGQTSAIKLLEEILDVAWSKMDNGQRVEFLMDIVDRNMGNIRV
jgi:hypothetical protein